MAEALNAQTPPPWWILMPEKGQIALKNIPFPPPEERCIRISTCIADTSLNKFEGVILGAPGKTDISLLKENGFSWCYPFAVIPSLKSPHWCISTENKQISAMGLNLYTPQHRHGKIAKIIAQTLNLPRMSTLGLPGLGTGLLIGLRKPPALLRSCEEWTGARETFFNFSQGARGPFQKITIQAVEKNGTPGLYIKVADTKKAGARIDNEARVLTALNSNAAFACHVPDLFFSGEHGKHYLLAQSVVPGTSGPDFPNKLLFTFLTKLIGNECVPLTSLPFWRKTRHNILATPQLERFWEKIKNSLTDAVIPKTIMHGDFAPWNVLIHGEKVQVIDWECCEPEGLPFFDIFHYVLRYGFLVGNWSGQRALNKIQGLINSALFQKYLEKTNMDMNMVRTFLELYLIVSLTDEDVRTDRGFRDQHLALLNGLGAS